MPFLFTLKYRILEYDHSELYHLQEYSARTSLSDLFPSPARGEGGGGGEGGKERGGIETEIKPFLLVIRLVSVAVALYKCLCKEKMVNYLFHQNNSTTGTYLNRRLNFSLTEYCRIVLLTLNYFLYCYLYISFSKQRNHVEIKKVSRSIHVQ